MNLKDGRLNIFLIGSSFCAILTTSLVLVRGKVGCVTCEIVFRWSEKYFCECFVVFITINNGFAIYKLVDKIVYIGLKNLVWITYTVYEILPRRFNIYLIKLQFDVVDSTFMSFFLNLTW